MQLLNPISVSPFLGFAVAKRGRQVERWRCRAGCVREKWSTRFLSGSRVLGFTSDATHPLHSFDTRPLSSRLSPSCLLFSYRALPHGCRAGVRVVQGCRGCSEQYYTAKVARQQQVWPSLVSILIRADSGLSLACCPCCVRLCLAIQPREYQMSCHKGISHPLNGVTYIALAL